MSFFGWSKRDDQDSNCATDNGAGRDLQAGLFQIAHQACHILVQVNNTHNVSYGGSNSVTNVSAYSSSHQYTASGGGGVEADSRAGSGGTVVATTCSSSSSLSSPSGVLYGRNVGGGGGADGRIKDQDVVVLLPPGKSRTPRIKHKLATVTENARLDVSTPSYDDDLDIWDQSGFMLRNDFDDPLNHGRWGGQEWCRPSCIPITFILVLIVLVVLLPLLDHAPEKSSLNATYLANESVMSQRMSDCRLGLVESIPIGLAYPNGSAEHPTTFATWMDLIGMARNSVEIASLYWTMNREDIYPDDSAYEGEAVLKALLEAGRDRGIALRIAQNVPSELSPNINTEYLAKKANAVVRSLNFAALIGGGVLHTKLWLIDRTHVYLGSANMDWRSLTQVKELGIVAYNCSCIANDLAKIFDVYWKLGEDGKVPATWPKALSTRINMENPMAFVLNGNKYRTFFASSPPPFSPEGRTGDIDAILRCIERAEKFIYVAVMDYFPLTLYTPKRKYWPVIDDALRAAAIERKVEIRLLINKGRYSAASEDYFLKALEDLTNSFSNVKIEVRRFTVPTNASFDKIPYSRIYHNKFMVTETTAYIGTSNWSGDYFTTTAGIGVIFEDADPRNDNSIRDQLEAVFVRDWTSDYAHPLNASCENLLIPKKTLLRSQIVPPLQHQQSESNY
uniref:PLD phosphodiesterase domain-containing protein n=1 Tax=Trichogramma kaykai TaxID=54128 RepID=A0ABD2XDW7_9HYME